MGPEPSYSAPAMLLACPQSLPTFCPLIPGPCLQPHLQGPFHVELKALFSWMPL